MKRASNSLLILIAYPFVAFLRAFASPSLAGNAKALLRRTTRCFINRREDSIFYRAIFPTSSLLRSCNPANLGKGRIRGLVHGFPAVVYVVSVLLFCLPALSAAGETQPSAVDEISAIIRAEILMTMPEWNDADIRIEIPGGIKNAEFSAAGESFHLAPSGLKIGRRNVFAPIEVVRDGKTVRSMSVPAVVHISATAVVASRKIASGEVISEKDMREKIVETTDIGVVLLRDPKEIEGKIARRAFAAGDLLPLDAFTEPPLVRRGDTVSVRLERGGITLTSSARATENGRLGDVIQVKSEDFSSVVRARVTGRAAVSIQ
jgi:flagella basal body P-ring formation protein FlgA